MSETENNFPTISDASKILTKLADDGFGELPLQVIVAPDSTMQTIGNHAAGNECDNKKPVLMKEFGGNDGRLPVIMMSTERLSSGGGMATIKSQ